MCVFAEITWFHSTYNNTIHHSLKIIIMFFTFQSLDLFASGYFLMLCAFFFRPNCITTEPCMILLSSDGEVRSVMMFSLSTQHRSVTSGKANIVCALFLLRKNDTCNSFPSMSVHYLCASSRHQLMAVASVSTQPPS